MTDNQTEKENQIIKEYLTKSGVPEWYDSIIKNDSEREDILSLAKRGIPGDAMAIHDYLQST